MKKYNFVYKTVNRENGKYYIGKHSTDDLDDGYIGSGFALKTAISKYGKENFDLTVIKMFETPEEAYAYEEEIITKDVVSDKMSYNQRMGGTGGNFSGAGADALIRREKTKRKNLQDKINNQRVWCFNFFGRKVKSYKNVYGAVKAMGLGKPAVLAIRRCASEENKQNIQYNNYYWSYTNKIPEKCYTEGSWIAEKRKSKRSKIRVYENPEQ